MQRARQECQQQGECKDHSHHREWLKAINTQITGLNTAAKYCATKYNNIEKYQLRMQDNHSVETGWLSPLTAFDLYMNAHEHVNPVKIDSRGKRRVRLIGKAIITINQDTRPLIQLNPRSEQR